MISKLGILPPFFLFHWIVAVCFKFHFQHGLIRLLESV